MRRIIFAILALFSVDAVAQATFYVGFNLVDPQTREIHSDSWMLVNNGVIEAVGQQLPSADDFPQYNTVQFRDMSDTWAMPGLVDTHAHLTLGPLAWTKNRGQLGFGVSYNEELTAHNARELLRYGVTTIRNPGGETEINLAYDHAVSSGDLNGPAGQSAGLVIDAAAIAGLTVAPSAEQPIEAIVAEQVQAGAGWIKFYQSLTPEQLENGIKTAAQLGARSIVHTGAVSWTDAAEMGVDSIVHMMPISPDLLGEEAREAYQAQARPGAYAFFEWYEFVDLNGPEIQAMIEAMVQNAVHIDATLIAFEAAFWGDNPRITENPHLADVHPLLLENWQTTFRFDLGWKEDDYIRARKAWPKVLELTRMMYEAGVPMSIGTDQGNPWVVAGRSVHEEMALHVSAGIETWDVLSLATIDGARALDLEDEIGRLEPGFHADVLFLSADPTQDINHTLDIVTVLNNGREVEHESITKSETH